MNEQNPHNEHLIALLNRSIDGELSAKEQQELEAILTASAAARELEQELRASAVLMDEAPGREPPAYLRDAIVSSVRLPVSKVEDKRRLLKVLLPAHWLRTGVAVAAGLLLTVGIYQLGSRHAMDPNDAGNMVGTVVKPQLPSQGPLLDSAQFDLEGLSGTVRLHGREQALVLDINIKSDYPLVMHVDIAGSGLSFGGISDHQISGDSWGDSRVVDPVEGSVQVPSQGERHYSLWLERAEEGAAVETGPLKLEFFAGDRLVHKTELNVSLR